MTAQEAQTLIRYTGWASRKILEAVRALPAEERDRPNGVSHESIGQTAAHIYWADLAWLRRLHDPAAALPPKANWTEADANWEKVLDQWTEWAAGLQDSETSRVVEYKSLLFGVGRTPVNEIVMHVANHATLHRGQVMGMLRQLGIAPPPTDMIYFFREQAS